MPVVAVALLAAAAMPPATARTAPEVASAALAPEELRPVAMAASEPVSVIAGRGDIAPVGVRPVETGPEITNAGHQADGALEPAQPGIDAPAPPPSLTFQGITNACNGCAPPDTVGDVGPSHYVQMVNTHFAIWNKNGTRLVPPTSIGSLFAPIANCNLNWGDPIVLHDQLANRWILTQFTATAPFLLCIAVSQTANPTGAYFLYAFDSTNFADYPKYGVWPNGLYAATREFNGATFVGVGAYVFNKAAMYAGGAAVGFKFLVAPGTTPFRIGDGLLPADIDGTALPAGANPPNPFVGTMDDGGPYGAPADALNLWHFSVNFTTGIASFTFIKQIAVPAFDSIFPCSPGSRDCIPQPGTTRKIDILSYRQRPMHRLAYRNFSSYESLVTNQSVEAQPGIAGVRWYEIRNPLTAGARVFQRATHVVNDGNHRWMGSIAQDKNGNMALGYSVSGTNLFPGIRYVGRLAGDQLHTMPWTERVLFNGAGSQTGTARWGDYTSMNIDPSDNCTFWYTNEYYAATSSSNWTTRIGRFKFPNC